MALEWWFCSSVEVLSVYKRVDLMTIHKQMKLFLSFHICIIFHVLLRVQLLLICALSNI